MRTFRLAAAIGLFLALIPAAASAQRSVPSCYAAAHVQAAPPPPARAVFLFVDQTTALDLNLAATVRQNMARLLRPGTSFTVASFADFAPGHYARILATGTIEQTVPPGIRASVATNALRRLDACLGRQAAFAARLAQSAFAEASAGDAATFSQSEIMASLRHLSSRVAGTRVRDRIVILASDMLEHSSAADFYRNRAMRRIDPGAELARARRQHLTANFGGARVYVVGAGVLPPQPGGNGRTIPALDALESFWTGWFHASNARLAAFGRPDLAMPVQ